jgi:hypothetical protein
MKYGGKFPAGAVQPAAAKRVGGLRISEAQRLNTAAVVQPERARLPLHAPKLEIAHDQLALFCGNLRQVPLLHQSLSRAP